jgi:hypothetical protein
MVILISFYLSEQILSAGMDNDNFTLFPLSLLELLSLELLSLVLLSLELLSLS